MISGNNSFNPHWFIRYGEPPQYPAKYSSSLFDNSKTCSSVSVSACSWFQTFGGTGTGKASGNEELYEWQLANYVK